jgi:subtilase family serine protease
MAGFPTIRKILAQSIMIRILVRALRYVLVLSATVVVASASIASAQETTPLALALRNINGTQDLGRRSGGDPVEVTLTLHRNHEAELQQLIQKQHEPGSPAYHRFLTSEAFDRYFAPTKAQLEYVSGALRDGGFQIERISADGAIVTAVARSGVAENFFRTEIHSVRQNPGQLRYANASLIAIPAHLSAAVAGVRINNLVIARVMYKRANLVPNLPQNEATKPEPQTAHPNALGAPYALSGYALPGAVAVSFDLPVQHNFTGTGHTAAIVIDSDVLDSDLNTFFSYCKIHRTGSIPRVSIDGGIIGSESNGTDAVEAYLDVETVAGLAPGANVAIYVMPNLSFQSISDAYASIVNNNSSNHVEVVNSSFGGDESGHDPGIDSTFQKGVALGITFAASSGDSGSSYISYPASNPNVAAIGGTTYSFNSNTGAYVSETGLNDSTNFSPPLQGGGGVSSVYSLPTYQSGTAGLTNTTGRNIPDVCFPGELVAIYTSSQGGWIGLGGTSWSSPIFAAWQATTNQERHSRFGLVNTNIYRVFKRTKYTNFRDITRGSNGTYNCKSNYDDATGIGSPKGNSLSKGL